MPYAWSGVCYQDTTSALAAFARSVPDANASGINTFTAAPTINASGLVTWSISNRPLNTTTATTRTGTTQLPTCASPTADQWPMQHYSLLLGMFFALFLGFRTGYRP